MKKSFVVAIGIIVLIALVLIVFFVMKQKSVSVTSWSTHATSTIDITTWKTYSNSQYGFAVQIPKDWKIVEHINDIPSAISFNSPSNEKIFDSAIQNHQLEGPAFNITFAVYGNIVTQAKGEGIILKTGTLSEYVQLSQNIFFNPQKITFAGQNAFRGSEAGMFDTDAIWINKDNYLEKILLQSNVGMDKVLRDKILSTFKFTK